MTRSAPAEAAGRLPGWVSDPRLLDTWARVADRLERAGLVAVGATRVPAATAPVRHAVGDLVGRPVLTGACTIDLARLDQRLRARAGLGVVQCAELVLGRELRDRPGQRGHLRRAREEPFHAAAQTLARTHLVGEPWVDAWLDELRGDGVVARLPDPTTALVDAVRVLLAVTRPDREVTGARTELAAQVLHDAHGLDDGRAVTRLVLRALACRASCPRPVNAQQRQALWDEAGVLADRVSTTCLTLGLRWDTAADETWARLAGSGHPFHVTGWDLRRRGATPAAGQQVLVCENPRVLQAFAEVHGASRPVVCTSGRPNLVVLGVLQALAAAGAELRYHGDFDWPGIAIANEVVRRFGAHPWRMSAADYDSAPGVLPLEGTEVEAWWDAELGAAMRRRGVAVHEEAVLDRLLRTSGRGR